MESILAINQVGLGRKTLGSSRIEQATCLLASIVYRRSGASSKPLDVLNASLLSSCPAASPTIPFEPCFLGPRASIARCWGQSRCPDAFAFLHTHTDFSDTPKETTKCTLHFGIELFLHQAQSKGVECFHVLIEAVSREIAEAFEGIDDYWPPSNNIALLRLLVE